MIFTCGSSSLRPLSPSSLNTHTSNPRTLPQLTTKSTFSKRSCDSRANTSISISMTRRYWRAQYSPTSPRHCNHLNIPPPQRLTAHTHTHAHPSELHARTDRRRVHELCVQAPGTAPLLVNHGRVPLHDGRGRVPYGGGRNCHGNDASGHGWFRRLLLFA
jgi:hypothetical protein